MDQTLLLHVLKQTQSPNDLERGAAERQLQQFEDAPHFLLQILELIGNKSVELDYRLMATLYLKNVCFKRWKNLGYGGTSRESIGQGILQLLTLEMESKIAIQLGVTLGFIGLIDFPARWSNLFHTLVQICDSADVLARARGLLALHRCLKAVIDAEDTTDQKDMTQASRQLLNQIGPQLFSVIEKHWKISSNFISSIQSSKTIGSTSEILSAANICNLSQKILFNLACHGFVSLQDPAVVTFVKMLPSRLETWTYLRKSSTNESELAIYLEKFLTSSAKFVLQTQENRPVEFAPFLSTFCTVYFTLLKLRLHDQFATLVLLFYHNVLICTKYRGDPQNTPGAQQLHSFFISNVVIELGRLLLTQYLLLTPEELEEWENDPEGFANEELRGNSSKRSKAAAEVLFSTILRKYSDILVPEILSFTTSVLQASDNSLPYLFSKDSCYQALAMAYYELRDRMDFKTLYQTFLSKEFQNNAPNYKIVKRRVLQVIEGWSSGIPSDILSFIYPLLINVMNNEDYVLRLWALITLRSVINEIYFDLNAFLPYLKPCIEAMVKLVSESNEGYTCKTILEVVSEICKQSGSHIVQFSSDILNTLVGLWKRLDGEKSNLLKEPILQTIKSLVPSMGEVAATQFQPNLIPIIIYCTDMRDDALYVLEPGLELWLEVVRYSVELTPPLLELFPRLCQLITPDTFDSLRHVLHVVNVYIAKGSQQSNFLPLLGNFIPVLHSLLIDSLFQLKPGHLVGALRTLNILFMFFPADTPTHVTRILQNMIQIIFQSSKQHDLVTRAFFSSLATLLLTNKSAFFSLISNNEGLQLLLQIWIEKAATVNDPEILQRYAKAFCALLTFNEVSSQLILGYLPQIVAVITKSLEGRPSRIIDRNPPPESKLIDAKDPFILYELPSFAIDCLNRCATLHGQHFQQALQAVDPLQLQKLQELHQKKK